MFVRQTVFYTPSQMTVNDGDQITGQLTCAPNARNNRDLDITIAYKVSNEAEEKVVQYKMFVVFSCYFVDFHLRLSSFVYSLVLAVLLRPSFTFFGLFSLW